MMNGFNPPVTPEKIVKEGWRFSIPIYQRLFVWESEQIDRLLEDLWKASESRTPYYLGVITTVEQEDGKNGRVFSVVDGQQRLTFLMLFFCECSARIVEDEIAKKFVLVETRNTSAESLRIRFIGRDEDESDIQHYLDMGRAEVKNWDEIKNWNFRQFHERMEIFGKKHNDWEIRKDGFIKYVYENTSFLANELVGYSNADLNLYFEKMNSTGRQLSPLDQLKGILTSCANDKAYASEWNDCFDFDKTRRAIEANRKEEARRKENAETGDGEAKNGQDFNYGIDDIVDWDGEVGDELAPSQESASFARLPMRPEVLALHALQLTLAAGNYKNVVQGNVDCFSPRHLLESFNKVLNLLDPKKNIDHAQFAADFMKALKNYRDWIDGNIIYLRGEEEADGDVGSNSSGLEYDFRNDISAGKTNKTKMRQLQSMLYVSSGEKQEWILNAYNAYKNHDSNNSDFDLFDTLRKQMFDNVNGIKPEDLSYSPGMNRRPFWTLDYLLWEKVYDAVNAVPKEAKGSFSDEPKNAVIIQPLSKNVVEAIIHYRFTQNRSVEHLHPQTPQNPQIESEEWCIDREKNNDAIRNCFGNLCMISQSTNSSFSNEPVNVKFEKLRNTLGQQSLQSIKLMLMFVACDSDHSKWTPKQAIGHGSQMLRILGVDDKLITEWEKKLDSININAAK